MAWEDELALATKAARKAGDLLRNPDTQSLVVRSSAGRDVKLQSDLDAEEVILAVLRQMDYPILTEETGEHGHIGPDTVYWVVDPLDGTVNYSRGLSLCCTSIALCQGEEPLLGVVYHFALDDLYCGIVGEDATKNGVPIHVSDVTETSKAIILSGFPAYRTFGTDALMQFVETLQRFKKVRLLGTAALSLAFVAAGYADAYAEEEIRWWDIAAGTALVLAAGGHADLAKSDANIWGRHAKVSSSPHIWDEKE